MSRYVVLPFVTLLAGCPLLEIEAEVGEACLSYRDVEVPGVTSGHVTHGLVFDDLSEVHELLAHDPELRFVRAEIRAISGADGFTVERAAIAIASGDPDATLPTLPVYGCDGDCPTHDGALSIPATTQESAVPYLAGDTLVVDLDLTGALPAQAWRMDVDVCVQGKVAYRAEL